ncbi:MAG: VWA domain-containing protein [Solirubrobacteraceae bacterium]|nr:VWA domain-containing protein [Solirubrobacteraceae bacterium]
MTFVAPLILIGLVLVPLAIWAYVRHDVVRRRSSEAFATAPLMPAVAPRRAGAARHIGPVLYLLAFTLLLIAIARPKAEATVKVNQASVMLVTDRSGSMNAQDVSGGRMAAAKKAGNTFLSMVPDDVRVGLIAFSHQVQLLQSPTVDRDAVKVQLDRLKPGGSTAAGDALARAMAVLRPEDAKGKPAPAAIILLSDGESVRGQDPIPIAQDAKKAGVKIYTVALGTDQGVLRTEKPDGTVREQRVPPDKSTLAQIASVSGGEFFDAPDAAALDRVYETLGKQVAERKEMREVTGMFAGGSLILLVLGAGASMALLGRLP